MALNPDKSDAVIIGTHQRSSSYSSLASVDIAGSAVPLADHMKVLGVTLDQDLTINQLVYVHSTVETLRCVSYFAFIRL